ncbi:orofacial cleft 1 candidate gene 1 protein homolog isoform X2 [Aphelocoma coerulescens]|uniref:orofacial cleft 1 candidate gene 1 protein homolog isoform X2 n=1 Tax=Aphelocoma coerulescens TaxID=39617 RepID=UPI00360541A6
MVHIVDCLERLLQLLERTGGHKLFKVFKVSVLSHSHALEPVVMEHRDVLQRWTCWKFEVMGGHQDAGCVTLLLPPFECPFQAFPKFWARQLPGSSVLIATALSALSTQVVRPTEFWRRASCPMEELEDSIADGFALAPDVCASSHLIGGCGRHCHHRDSKEDSVSKGEEKLGSRKKFQQKAPKQTKQKKSKSAEFLMVKEERAATEGIENPAFNISSTDLSAYQPSEEKVIRHDKPDSTLAAHQQKLGLQAHAEPRGNEYSRNYFDPLMDEEINPRQCGMEVSEEDPVKFDEKNLYSTLMKLLDEENKMDFPAHVVSEDFPDAVMPVSSSKACDLHKELEDEEIPPYIEQFERDIQDDIILLGRFSLEQVRVKNYKTILSLAS